MNKIILFGSTGRLGREIHNALSMNDGAKIIAPTRDIVDLTRDYVIMEFLEDHAPDMIINAAAMTNVLECETNLFTMDVNRNAPYIMAEYCKLNNCKLLQISTNYVFGKIASQVLNTHCVVQIDTIKEQPFKPQSKYGWSKAYAEMDIQSMLNSDDYRIVRVQNLYGGTGNNDTIPIRVLRQSKNPPITYSNIRVKPTRVTPLANAICTLFRCDNSGIVWLRDNTIEHICSNEYLYEKEFIESVMITCGIKGKMVLVDNPLRPDVILRPTITLPGYKSLWE
jgi:dTDP-4-dehydrorhamnose reductase